MKRILLVALFLIVPACGASVQRQVKHATTVGDQTALTLAEAADDVELAAYKAGTVNRQDHHNFSVEMVKVYQAIADIATFAKSIQPGQPVDAVKLTELGLKLTQAVKSAVNTLPASTVRDTVQAKLDQAVGLAKQLGGK